MSTIVQKQDLNSRIFVVVSVAGQSASDDRRKQVQFRKQNLSSEKSYFSVFLVCSASHRWRRRRWQLPTSTSIRCLWNPEPVKSCEASQFSLGCQYYQLLAQWTTPSNRTLHWNNYLRWRKSSFDKWTLFLRSEKHTRLSYYPWPVMPPRVDEASLTLSQPFVSIQLLSKNWTHDILRENRSTTLLYNSITFSIRNSITKWAPWVLLGF